MDWNYAWGAIEQAVPGLLLMAIPIPLFWIWSKPDKKFLACSPGVIGTFLFLVVFVLSGVGPSDLIVLPTIALGVATLLVAPSILALRKKALGFAHIFTILGSALTWFVGAMAVSHDWL
jgi:hypothetical protein